MIALDFGLTTLALRRDGGGTGFNPANLPGLVAWYDPSDLATVFQDAAMTVPVVADGDPVGAIQDKSGNGWHATNATAAARPTYRIIGGNACLQFDGANDVLTAGIPTLADSSIVMAAAFAFDAAPVATSGACFACANFNNGGAQLGWNTTTGFYAHNGSGVFGGGNIPSLSTSSTVAGVMAVYTGAGSFYYHTTNGETAISPSGVHSQPTKPLTLGRGTQGGRDAFFPGRFYGGAYSAAGEDEARSLIAHFEAVLA